MKWSEIVNDQPSFHRSNQHQMPTNKHRWWFCHFISALSKPIQRSPWILLCTWPSTSQPRREPKWCASCPPWRRPPPLSASLSSSPHPDAQAGLQQQPHDTWLQLHQLLATAKSWWPNKTGGANVRKPRQPPGNRWPIGNDSYKELTWVSTNPIACKMS